MASIINASPTNGIVQTADGSGVLKIQSNSVTTNALAWVNFDGTAGTIRSSYNVTSVTKNSAADYTINFTTAMTDADYVFMGSVASNVAFSSTVPIVKAVSQAGAPSNKTTTACQIITPYYASALFDNITQIYCTFHGN